ncbi:glycosyltransferase [Vibrio diabolicus]|uniref:glycosyltransferase n=1 Tax=Vibrio diabolicus TaxID=50719 RepID=UPI00249461BE|nr:glycosyltransferase [Vibrio diabolicus]
MLALHNGISTSNFVFSKRARCEIRSELGISEEQELILAVGSLSEQKDYPNLFAAVKNLVEKKDNFQVVIAGYGSLQAELENQLCLLGIEDKVRFLGIRQDISRLMSAADIFVLSSAWEGFGLVVAEAMACERIVVATDCGGVKEVVEDAGFLVPPRNSELLADALGNALLLNEDERHFMGVKARERIVSSFSLDASMHKWLQLYSSRTEAFD